MAKLTKSQSKLHLQAMDLVNSNKELTNEEKEFILQNYDPNATNLTSVAGAFFTPIEVAQQFAFCADPNGMNVVVDLCAGIGSLGYWIWAYDDHRHSPEKNFSDDIKEFYCVELNPEYVKVGKRILPQAHWIQGSVLNQKVIAQLPTADLVISNPPFGSIASDDDRSWIPYNKKSLFEYNVVSVASTISNCGVFILPQNRSNYDIRNKIHDASEAHKQFKEITGITIHAESWILDEYENSWVGTKQKVDFVSFEKEGCYA